MTSGPGQPLLGSQSEQDERKSRNYGAWSLISVLAIIVAVGIAVVAFPDPAPSADRTAERGFEAAGLVIGQSASVEHATVTSGRDPDYLVVATSSRTDLEAMFTRAGLSMSSSRLAEPGVLRTSGGLSTPPNLYEAISSHAPK